MPKNEIDAKTLDAALDRLLDVRAQHIQKMANPKTALGGRPRLFLDVQEAIEKLEQLRARQKKPPVPASGTKVFKG